MIKINDVYYFSAGRVLSRYDTERMPMTKAKNHDAIAALSAELHAADVAYALGQIAAYQHRIACALASEYREGVLGHLADLGISEESVTAFCEEPLTREQMLNISTLLATIQMWRPQLRDKLAQIAIARKVDRSS